MDKIRDFFNSNYLEKLAILITLLLVIISFALLFLTSLAKPKTVTLPEVEAITSTPKPTITPSPEEIKYFGDMAFYAEESMDILMEVKECSPEWYRAYKDMVDLYGEIGEPDKLEECFTEEELSYLYRVVETETHGADFESKVHIADVVFNRMKSAKFPDDIVAVVRQANQFAYGRTDIDEETKLACAYAFDMEDTTDGALFFQKSKTMSGREYVFTDAVNHSFFK